MIGRNVCRAALPPSEFYRMTRSSVLDYGDLLWHPSLYFMSSGFALVPAMLLNHTKNIYIKYCVWSFLLPSLDYIFFSLMLSFIIYLLRKWELGLPAPCLLNLLIYFIWNMINARFDRICIGLRNGKRFFSFFLLSLRYITDRTTSAGLLEN